MNSYVVLSLVALGFTLVSAIPGKRQDVNVLTTFNIGPSCNSEQSAAITQANKDALTLANYALDNAKELLATTNTIDKYIDFGSQAAQDYWGLSSPYQQRIFDTLYRATQSYRGSGWSDWWNSRYVNVACSESSKACGTGPAYTVTDRGDTYPTIIFCPTFFGNLSSHGDMVNRINQDTTGTMKLNVRNLRSQATTALHEWLHIAGYSSEVCEGGCIDTYQVIGGIPTRTYKAGKTKLLALKDPERAANTNDNYAYFATSRFMEKTFGVYPPYPLVWFNNLTPDQNQAIEDQQPGSPVNQPTWDTLEDSGEGTDTATAAPAAATLYPAWYQPVINAAGSTTLPPIAAPSEAVAVIGGPDIDSIVCQTTDGSPVIADCVHAFGTLDSYSSAGALHGSKGGTWWAGYVESCALAIYYTDDWSDSCSATLDDVQGHASAIFEACEDGSLGTVGGYVPFAVPNCPAYIQISHTNGQPPQGT